MAWNDPEIGIEWPELKGYYHGSASSEGEVYKRQIWDYSFAFFDNDPYLFGNGLKAKKKVAYACSFGTVSNHDKHPEYVIDGIKGLDYISVRDENSADIVER